MSETTNLKRRRFLLAAGAGGAGAAAALIGAKSEPEQTAGTTTQAGTRKGYQLTEHVRNYYRTART